MPPASDCCANTGEMRTMMEDVAEKAAQRAATSVANQVRLELNQLESRLQRELSAQIKQSIDEFLGMTPHEHAISHDKMRRVTETFDQVKSAVWQRVVAVGTVLALIAFGSGQLSERQLEHVTKVLTADYAIRQPDDETPKRGGQ